jgi:nitrite reductase/ring-hydroxylating ferredoxin subunit
MSNPLPPGTIRQLDGDVLQVRLDRGIGYCEAACTHRGGRLVHGHLDAARGRLVCPLHRSVFDLGTGEALGGPAGEALWVSTEHPDGTSTR